MSLYGLGVGDTLEYQFTLNTVKPEVPGHFWFEYSFQKDLINLDEQVDLDVPADKAVTVASADAQPVSPPPGRKLYHWSSSNLARPDPDAPPKSVKHWKPSDSGDHVFKLGAGGRMVCRRCSGIRVAVTPAIQAKVGILTKGLTSDEDKTRAIFNDVALHIHYVGLEFGIGRYQPHPADDVLSNEYGDCKDKHTLLADLS
jgi:transglutaminase-like putative cysteine protease